MHSILPVKPHCVFCWIRMWAVSLLYTPNCLQKPNQDLIVTSKTNWDQVKTQSKNVILFRQINCLYWCTESIIRMNYLLFLIIRKEKTMLTWFCTLLVKTMSVFSKNNVEGKCKYKCQKVKLVTAQNSYSQFSAKSYSHEPWNHQPSSFSTAKYRCFTCQG